MYMGRLFMLHTDWDWALTRARMPRALEVYSYWGTHIARTPKGLWGWGDNHSNQRGFESAAGGAVDPTRLTFPACPKVAELEASLPPWEKHRMVTDVSMEGGRTFILTPVGTVMACRWQIISFIYRSRQGGEPLPPSRRARWLCPRSHHAC
ncbi:hypothetical protein J8273_1099 [Carpediemonas membranifera]|uniref:Uncharacterized protein n=1 Tax=Carpediemonas membranifera TaxID=201153 RepID=A0A8J6B1B9_9EUKA|nr:hypothetical protein J8273_1099 [Carpediemonas membranifera]|eukprot:KAG9397190.1 hypothetical protein J8273_1099 [Carpediemonas membranifera]